MRVECVRGVHVGVCVFVDLLNFTIIFHGYIYLYMLVVLVMHVSDPSPTSSFPHAARVEDGKGGKVTTIEPT